MLAMFCALMFTKAGSEEVLSKSCVVVQTQKQTFV